MSSVYTVRYAPQALDDLRDLYSYVAFSHKEPATAQKLVNRIRKAARSLDALPGRHPVVDWEPWQSMGMHRFTVEDFLLFYLIDQSTRTVTLVRIVYGGPNKNNPNLFPIGDGFGLFVFFGKFNMGVRGR